MMRRNLALVLALALASPAAFAGSKTNGRKRLGELNTTKERWNELNSDEQLEDDKPKREVIRLPAQTKPVVRQTPPATRAPAARGPASVPRMSVPATPAFPVAAITFDEYMSENGRNPALSKAIPDHQQAFTDVTAPAVITVPGSESAAQANAAPAPAAGVNPSAVQAAAAAAAAAGLIPPSGSVPASGAVGGASQTGQPQNTGAPIR